AGGGVGAALKHGGKHGGRVLAALAFSRDSRHLATAGAEVVSLWDTATGERLREIQTETADHVEFSPDGRHVLTWYMTEAHMNFYQGQAQVWDVQTGQDVTPPLRHKNGCVGSASFSPDGRY